MRFYRRTVHERPRMFKLREFLRTEIKSDEPRALVVIGPLVVAYIFLREPAILNLGLIAISMKCIDQLTNANHGHHAVTERMKVSRPELPHSYMPALIRKLTDDFSPIV